MTEEKMWTWNRIARAGIVVCGSFFLLATWMPSRAFASKLALTGLVLIIPFMLWTILAYAEAEG